MLVIEIFFKKVEKGNIIYYIACYHSKALVTFRTRALFPKTSSYI